MTQAILHAYECCVYVRLGDREVCSSHSAHEALIKVRKLSQHQLNRTVHLTLPHQHRKQLQPLSTALLQQPGQMYHLPPSCWA